MISHGLWQRLGSDPGIVGKGITLSGRIYTVTGVMPPGFNLPLAGVYSEAQTDVWVPLDPSGAGQDRDGAQLLLRPAAARGHGSPGGCGSETHRQGDRQPGARARINITRPASMDFTT